MVMRIGVSFPTVEIGADLAVVRDFVRTAEDLGYTHLRVLDHVLGADPQFHPEVPVFYYTHASVTHEPFTLMAYLAALTTRIELTTAIIILPQRQTALVAKQAAEVDVLSGGRLRLGIGIGWNPVEYEALGEDFQTRGRRSEEQIEVLRLLWTQDVVTYSGRWHQISHAGLNPRPIQRPIPIWIGSGAPQTPIPPEAGMRRIARLADGWFPLFDLDDRGQAVIARIRQYTKEAGRDPGALGLEGRVNLAGTSPADWMKAVQGWEAIGATHLSVSTSGKAFQTPKEHLDAIRRFKHEVGL
jgi:probable F420-dependent oxidoreductase